MVAPHMAREAAALKRDIARLKAEIKQESQRIPEFARIAVDHGANIAYQRAIEQATRRYVVKASYVKKHLTLFPAGSSRWEARIQGTHRETLIDRFRKPKQRTVAVKHPRRSRGNPRAGVPRGRKLASITTEVRRGNPTRWRNAFWVPLKRNTQYGGNGLALAQRNGPGRDDFEVLHTISIGQIWRFMRDEMRDDIEAAVEAEYNRLANR